MFDINIPKDLFGHLLDYDLDYISKELLKSVSKDLENQVRNEIKSNLVKYATGETAESVKARLPKKSRSGGWYVFVGPSGYSKTFFHNGRKEIRHSVLTNAAKVVFHEYGTSREIARPFFNQFVYKISDSYIDKMQKQYEELIK